MKQASAATLALLSGGQYVIAELYDITLVSGQVYHFTSFQIPLSAAIYPSGTANSYLTGLTITRDTLTQKAGVEAGSMKLTIAPQPDSPNAPILIAGYPLLQACRMGLMDAALMQMSILYMAPPNANGVLDTSPGGVGYFLGSVLDINVTRFTAELGVSDHLAYMGTQQMPRNVWRTGCGHQVYDAGCALLKASFTVTGAVSSATDGSHFNTNLTQLDHYFELGVLTFTSGANNGLSATVSSFLHGSGAVVTRYPFPNVPTGGDTFSVYPGCDLTQATCTNKFANLAHFSGTPYIPVPETLLDGGVSAPPAQQQGGQAGQVIGSQPTGRGFRGKYNT